MTTNDAVEPVRAAAVPPDVPAEWPVRPMPRLGRGIVWSDIVAEIERDQQQRMRDAA